MSVLRQPDNPIRDSLRTSRSQHDAQSSAGLITQAGAAAQDGEDASALDLLVRVATGLAPERLPELAERLLVELGQTAAVSPAVRAEAWRVYARSRRSKGADGEARAALDRSYTLAPDPDVLVDLVTLTARLDGTGAAEPLVRDGLDRWPDEVSLRALSVSLARESGDPHRVRALLDDALRRHPDHPDMLTLLARLELDEGRPEHAIEPARRLISTRPPTGRALLVMAFCGVGRLAEDPGLLDAVVANRPDDPWLLTGVARALLDPDADRPADARTLLDRAHELDGDDVEIYRTRGMANAMLGDYAAAGADLEEAARSGGDPWLTAMRGEVARLAGDPQTALRHFADVDPADEPAWVPTSRAAALAALGDLDAARQVYQQALRRDSEDVTALCGLSEVELDHDGDGGLVTAEERLRRAVELAPSSARAHAMLGEVLRRSGRPGEAVTSFDRALALSPAYTYALASKGQALIASGSREEGVAALADAAAQEPGTAWILDTLVEELGTEEYGAADAVLRRLQRSVRSRGGDHTPVQVRRADLAAKHGEIRTAERFYRKAREVAPDDAELGRRHSDVLRGLGRAEEALEVLDGLPASVRSDPAQVWIRIDVLWALERLTEVRSELERLVAGERPPPIAVAALGEVHRRDGDRATARTLLSGVLDADEVTRGYALASLGTLEFDEGDVAAARRYLREAVDRDPTNAFAVVQLISLELAEGRAERVEALLEELARSGMYSRELAIVRATALYGLGDYPRALDVVDAYLAGADDDAAMLRLLGWVRLGLGQMSRAASSFRAAAELPDVPSGVVDNALALCRVSLWTDALRLAVAAREAGNPFAGVALAVVWNSAGDPRAAAQHVPPDNASQSALAALYAARSVRRGGDPGVARRIAVSAHARWPNDTPLRMELGECLAETGDPLAGAVFEELLARLTRQVNRDADDLVLQGRCLLRLRRAPEATQVLLQALSGTDLTAQVLLDLVHASLIDGDFRQAVILEHRAMEEITQLPAPLGRGLMATARRDLTVAAPHLSPEAGREAVRVVEHLREREAELDPEVATLVDTVHDLS